MDFAKKKTRWGRSTRSLVRFKILEERLRGNVTLIHLKPSLKFLVLRKSSVLYDI